MAGLFQRQQNFRRSLGESACMDDCHDTNYHNVQGCFGGGEFGAAAAVGGADEERAKAEDQEAGPVVLGGADEAVAGLAVGGGDRLAGDGV